MKKKLILAVVCLLSTFTIYSQVTQDAGVKLPEKTPPSPEAFAITKYGNLPINESTGKATFNVPIYTYKAGNLSLPISLNYMGNGVKVDALGTWTGINWTLDAGGVITRTVHHKPDELAVKRIFKEDIDALNLSWPYDDAAPLYQYFNSNSNMWDTQPDIFTFSFSGYSGSFFLDRDFKPTLIKGDTDIKIEIDGLQSTESLKLAQNKHFIITTPDGIKYFFGLNETQDTERVVVGPTHQSVSPLATTSFYLYRIDHPLNGRIFLEYIKTDAYVISESKSFSKIMYYSGAGVTLPPRTIIVIISEEPVEIPNPHFMPLESESLNYSQISNNIDRGVFLSRIYSQNSSLEVNFNSISTIMSGRFNFKNILQNIEVKNQNNSLFKAELDYIYSTNAMGITQRFFLNKVSINKPVNAPYSLGRKHQEYQFAYKNPLSIPDRFSFSQDHLGFYNAKTNGTLLPQPDNFLYGTFTGLYCNRDSDFEIRSTGVLTKITYPTGGFTKIEYEAPLEKEVYTENVTLTTYANGFDNHVDVLTDTYGGLGLYIDLDGTVQNQNGAYKTQAVNIQVTIASEATLLLHHNDLISVEISDTTDTANPIVTTQNAVVVSPDANTVNGNYIYTYNMPFAITKGHHYSVKLKLNPTSYFTTKLQAKLNFTYLKGEQLRNGEGIRVKRVSDYSQEYDSPTVLSSPTNIKRYYYTKIENLSKEALEYVKTYRTPTYIQQSALLVKDEMTPPTCFIKSYLGGELSSRPINYSEQNINNYEDVVISYGGDNFENGGIAKVFGKDIFNPVTITHDPEIMTLRYKNIITQYTGSPWLSTLHGQLLKETIIKKEQNIFYKLQEKSLYKAYTNSSHLLGHLFNIYIDCGPGEMLPYGNVTLGNYNLFERRLHSSITTTKKFIDPYPMVENIFGNLPDEADYKIITSSQTVQYNSAYKGLPTEIEVTGEIQTKNRLTKNKYLDQVSDLNNLSTQQIAAYTALEDKHIIAQPIEVVSYEKTGTQTEIVLSTKRTLYQDYNGKIVLEKVQTAKGTGVLEDRILFTAYDAHGNLNEVSLKDGSKVRYAYNNRGQVINKIENYEPPITNSGGELLDDVDTVGYTGNCFRTVQYPNSLVTTYQYDTITHLLTSITSPRCETTYYEYDAFQRLHYVKDNEGNILKENDTNYRR